MADVTASRRRFVVGGIAATAAAVAGHGQGGSLALPDGKFGYCGKITAKPGQRDALAELLLESSSLLGPETGCETYVVCTMPEEPDAVWVNEIWKSEADHDASLKIEAIRAVITRARPLIAGIAPGIKLRVVGGLRS